MSKTLDQCPSTAHEGSTRRPGKAERALRTRSLAGTVNGVRAYRSPEEYSDTPEFREFVEREFPAGASELLASSRRTFMSLMGASLALAGVASIPGCRRPDHTIASYGKDVPEDIIPGKPLYYATAMPLPGGGAEGLLVETHEGRPTKIEGNPLHPINQGKSSITAQAATLSLYDPDRLKFPVYKPTGKAGTWDDFAKEWAPGHFPKFDATGGKGLAFIVPKASSPTRDRLRDELVGPKGRWPGATWIEYEAFEPWLNAAAGAKIALGAPMREQLSLKDARVIVSLDRDFLTGEPGSLVAAREFAAGREPKKVGEHQYSMNRLYCVESGFSLTGGQADHRLRMPPSKTVALAVELGKAILSKIGTAASKPVADALAGVTTAGVTWTDAERKFIEHCAMDLLQGADTAARAQSVVLAGPTMPPEVHALCHAINAALGSLGKVCTYLPMSERAAANSGAQLAALASRIAKSEIDTLVCIDVNPCFDAPADTDFAAAYAKVPTTISLSSASTETAAASTWSLNGCHFLEAWGDVEAHDGTMSVVQPMIAPLYGPDLTEAEKQLPEREKPMPVMSDIEFLAYLLTFERPDGYKLVRETWTRAAASLGAKAGDFDGWFRRVLHNGLAERSTTKGAVPPLNFAGVAAALSAMKPPPAAGSTALDVVFTVGHIHDGRFANNGWLQELPDTGTRVCWDNPALMSPRTAIKLGFWTPGRHPYTEEKYPSAITAEISVGGRKAKLPVWILPGMADDTVIVKLGYGRRVCGLVGDGVGYDAYPLRTTSTVAMASGASATVAEAPEGKATWVASTQNHWTMEGRSALVRAIDLPQFAKFADDVTPHKDPIYGETAGKLNIAEKLGELTHTPPNISIYKHPYNQTPSDAAPGSVYSEGPQWGMTIDLSKCTGCGACTIACQAENNIPVVGKKEVAKGREMTWIRVDRYFTSWGEDEKDGWKDKGSDESPVDEGLADPSEMLHQPVACVHCENAPCETVCPVNATVHGKEGLNYMAYNRCIGTRYCANNCPYKVRRFNFFDYGVTKFNGGYHGQSIVESVAPAIPIVDKSGVAGSTTHNTINPNLIPPRLRQKLDQISRLQKNPDVTVRSRGVMEKCSYCVQRINQARIEINLRDDLDPKLRNQIPDGFFQVACQQACPSNAIIFGDILDAATEYTSASGEKRKGSRVHASRHDPRSYALLGYLNTRPRTSHMIRVRNPNKDLLLALGQKKRVEGWEHAPGGHGHDDHKKGDHPPSGDGAAKPHAFVDPAKRAEDGGYAMSLRVMQGVNG